MAKMYDSINVEAIPADAAEVLAYTDGIYANVSALRRRFPNARIHTISAIGQIPGEWIDVEPGCVWPPQTAVNRWRTWRNQGCRGFYSSISVQPTIRALLAPGENPEWFDANYTDVDHVDPGNEATQYADPGPYDISETTPAFEGDPAPAPAPPIPIPKGRTMKEVIHTEKGEYIRMDDESIVPIHAPATGSLLTNPAGPYKLPYNGPWDDATVQEMRRANA